MGGPQGDFGEHVDFGKCMIFKELAYRSGAESWIF